MKKFWIALASALFLSLAPLSVASAQEECFTVDAAKVAIGQWQHGSEAVWEYLKAGPKFDALLAWAKVQGFDGAVDSIVIVYVKGSDGSADDGSNMVIWAVSPDGKCVDGGGAHSWKMTEAQFNMIVGKVI